MKTLIALAFVAAAMTGSATAQEHQACRAGDFVPAFTFPGNSLQPENFNDQQIREVIRYARQCRFRTISVVVYDSSNTAISDLRADAMAAQLRSHSWPAGAIVIEKKPVSMAPSGRDYLGRWWADATFAFSDPDPDWTPPLESSPPRGAMRLIGPPAPYDPPNVMFDANSAMLSDASRSVAIEGGKIFKLENYRLIVLRGGATRTEANGAMLALARATVVREALIRSGIDPALIIIDPRVAIRPDEAPNFEWLDRRVTVDFSD